MFWRAPSRRAFAELKGDGAKQAFRALVTSGRAGGILAFDGETPVGWCALGPRSDFPSIERKRGYAVDDVTGVWSVNCFFVRKDRRSKGIARLLLAAAVEEARRAGAQTLEGYPVPLAAGVTRPGAFVYTGTLGMFEAAGFRVVQRIYPGSPLVRLPLALSRPAATKRRTKG
jgi:GNAT superfamily N-acetyltransferase